MAYFLCRYTEKGNDGKSRPPRELDQIMWNQAYEMFYDTLGGGRSHESFHHSLKNTRDAFDSHMDSGRVGWHTVSGQPSPLSQTALSVVKEYDLLSRTEVWEKIKIYSSGETAESRDAENQAEYEAAKDETSYTEGGEKVVISVRYERSAKLRQAAFRVHGYDCAACGFSFENTYGEWGKEYAEVHHLELISNGKGKRKPVNLGEDLIVLCANCHRMVHRRRATTLSLEELKEKINQAGEGK